MIKCRPTLLFFNYARPRSARPLLATDYRVDAGGARYRQKMEARKLKLHPITPELGKRYDQFQKKFREIFGRYSLRLSGAAGRELG